MPSTLLAPQQVRDCPGQGQLMPAHESYIGKRTLKVGSLYSTKLPAEKKVEDVRHTNTNSGRFRALATLYFD